LAQAVSAGTEEEVVSPQLQAQGPVMAAPRRQKALVQAASAGTEEVVSPQLQAQGAVMAAPRPQRVLTQAAAETGTPQLQAPGMPRPQEALARAVAPGLVQAAVPQLRQAPPVCGLPATP
jgi:hypothetical protein